MKFPLISAGELFELLRPAAFVLSALLSIWVLASARRRQFPLYMGLAWASGTFFLPFVVLPVYLVVLIIRHWSKRRPPSRNEHMLTPNAEAPSLQIRFKLLLPFAYGAILLGATCVYLYRDNNSVDAHLARAVQAKLKNEPAKTIREYGAALALEENPHTHKLLGLELADAHKWDEALKELRLAEQGGEPDDSLPFRIARLLKAQGDQRESMLEYQRFLLSRACTQTLPDSRCEIAQTDVRQRAR